MAKQLTEGKLRVLKAVCVQAASGHRVTLQGVGEQVGVCRQRVQYIMLALADFGLVTHDPRRYRSYRPTAAGARLATDDA